jgi:pimeloyl-ACP methyl ester carboxylesterase
MPWSRSFGSSAMLAAGCAMMFATGADYRALAADSAPMVIARSGYLYAGGQVDKSIEGSPMTGHIYAEFQIPAKLEHPYPIVMVPGGSQTGTNFTGNIAGGEGWSQYFLRRGYAVYIVDQVARGRSAYYSQAFGPLGNASLQFAQQRFVSPEKYNLWPQAHLHTQFPGTGDLNDPFFQKFWATQYPSLPNFTKQQELNAPALVALFDKIGPAILLTHSQSGAFNWPVAEARPNLVKAIVAIEPSGPPVHDMVPTGAPDWFKDAAPTKISGLADIPLAYDPPVPPGGALDVVQQDKADAPDLVRCWMQKEPARKLPKIAGIPTVIIQSEASYHAPYDHCTAKWLTQAGVANTYIRLADKGVHGNGHMMMIENNSDDIAGVIEGWLAQQQSLKAPAAAK